MIIHLPCRESVMSRGMYFTLLSTRWIEKMIGRAGFHRFEIDHTTLRHGVLVVASKD